jgi:hypothetical protein
LGIQKSRGDEHSVCERKQNNQREILQETKKVERKVSDWRVSQGEGRHDWVTRKSGHDEYK